VFDGECHTRLGENLGREFLRRDFAKSTESGLSFDFFKSRALFHSSAYSSFLKPFLLGGVSSDRVFLLAYIDHSRKKEIRKKSSPKKLIIRIIEKWASAGVSQGKNGTQETLREPSNPARRGTSLDGTCHPKLSKSKEAPSEERKAFR